jgi:hypothetical protein
VGNIPAWQEYPCASSRVIISLCSSVSFITSLFLYYILFYSLPLVVFRVLLFRLCLFNFIYVLISYSIFVLIMFFVLHLSFTPCFSNIRQMSYSWRLLLRPGRLNAKIRHVGRYDAPLYCVCEKRWSYLENSDCLALVSIVCSIQSRVALFTIANGAYCDVTRTVSPLRLILISRTLLVVLDTRQ